MNTIRVIPRLDIKGPNLVKGIHLEGLRVLGKPEHFAKYYYSQGADELIFMDVVASLYERNSLHDIISNTAKEIFIPLTVGGGLRTIEDIRNVLRAGADKVSINTAAIKNPNIITEAALKFGSSTIVVAIEAIKEYKSDQYLAYTDNGREYTGIDIFEWAQQVEELGAGELVITSVDREGTGEGMDIAMINKISKLVDIPVIAHGGVGKKEDVKELFFNTEAKAISLASLLHYDYIQNGYEIGRHEGEGNIEFLNKKKSFHTFKECSLESLKKYLFENKISVRVEINE
jgi:cyclase